jgi:ribonuclease HI
LSPIEIWTDGSCKGTLGTGFGGWGWVCSIGEPTPASVPYVMKDKGSELETTSNRMELTAVLRALLAFGHESMSGSDAEITVHSDSEYVVKMFTENRLEKFEKRGWKTANHQPVANLDLLMPLRWMTKQMNVRFVHVKGHAGNELNEEADRLAQSAADSLMKEKNFGSHQERQTARKRVLRRSRRTVRLNRMGLRRIERENI